RKQNDSASKDIVINYPCENGILWTLERRRPAPRTFRTSLSLNLPCVWLCVSFVDKAAPLQTSCLLCDTALCVDPVCVCVYLERKAQ
ncbi:AGAP012300-PA, partial [Anopheles gambiae str. PEST]